MQIKPFYPDPDSLMYNKNYQAYKYSKIDVHFIQGEYTTRAKVIISRKILTDNAFLKIIFVYECIDQFIEEITNIEEFEKSNFNLRLKYITTSGFSLNNNFAQMIYRIDSHSGEVVSHMEYHKFNYEYYPEIRFNKSSFVIDKDSDVVYITKDKPLRFVIEKACNNSIINYSPNLTINTTLKDCLEGLGKFSFTSYSRDMFESDDTFSESSLLQLSYDKYVLDESEITQSDANSISIIKESLNDFLTTLIKPYLISNMDNITFIYERGKIGLKEFTNPFGNKVIKKFVYDVLRNYNDQITKSVMSIEDMFGPVRLIVKFTDGYFKCHCRFLEDDPPLFIGLQMLKVCTIVDIDELLSRHFMMLIYGSSSSEMFNIKRKTEFERINDLLQYHSYN